MESNLPGDLHGVCAVFAVLWRFGEADVSVLVDSAVVHEEVLVDLHDCCGFIVQERISETIRRLTGL